MAWMLVSQYRPSRASPRYGNLHSVTLLKLYVTMSQLNLTMLQLSVTLLQLNVTTMIWFTSKSLTSPGSKRG